MTSTLESSIQTQKKVLVSAHDNDIFFDVVGMKGVSFTEIDHSITSGQPYHGASSGIKKEAGHDQAFIRVNAGKKNRTRLPGGSKTGLERGKLWFATVQELIPTS